MHEILAAICLRSAEITLDRQSGGFGDLFARGSRCTEAMLAEYAAVCNAELHHQFFFGVMCNKRYIQTKPSVPSLFLCVRIFRSYILMDSGICSPFILRDIAENAKNPIELDERGTPLPVARGIAESSGITPRS